LVSTCAAWCFNYQSGLTSSHAKGNKAAGDGMAVAELVVCIRGDETFRRISTAGTSKLRFDLVGASNHGQATTTVMLASLSTQAADYKRKADTRVS
jgi:hypothetical protein